MVQVYVAWASDAYKPAFPKIRYTGSSFGTTMNVAMLKPRNSDPWAHCYVFSKMSGITGPVTSLQGTIYIYISMVYIYIHTYLEIWMVYGDMLLTNYEPGKSIEHGVPVGTRWLPATVPLTTTLWCSSNFAKDCVTSRALRRVDKLGFCWNCYIQTTNLRLT